VDGVLLLIASLGALPGILILSRSGARGPRLPALPVAKIEDGRPVPASVRTGRYRPPSTLLFSLGIAVTMIGAVAAVLFVIVISA
jgi:hypothetical protein